MNPEMKPTPPSNESTSTRRAIVKTAAWVVPAVVTLAVTPSFAGQASGERPS